MSLIVTLFLIGLVLLAAEVFVPGGVLGILGGLLMIAGCVLAFMNYGSGWGFAAFGIGLVLVGGVLWAEYMILPKTKLGGAFFLKKEIEGSSQQDPGRKELVGKDAVAVTALAPSGYVMVEGKRYEAISQSGFINKGDMLCIVAFDQFNLIVRKK